MKIAVIDDYQDAFRSGSSFARLEDHTVVIFNDTEKDPVKLAARLADAEVVVLTQQRSPFPRAVIEQLPRLKLIVQTGPNNYHIDEAACAEQGVTIANAFGGSPHTTAELTWGLILASMRHIPFEVEALKQGRWQSTVGTGLNGRTLGVYAPGLIGDCVAQVGKAFGMRVICWGRDASLARAREAGYGVPASREAFFAGADIVSLHLPLNNDTRGIVTAADLACMRPDALFVNTSRAPLIAPGALVAALKAGHPGFAAVDVFEEEPVLGGNHPLLQMPNVICTPHLGYVEQRTYDAIYTAAVERILAFA